MKTARPFSVIAIIVVAAVLWTAFLGHRHVLGLASPLDRLEAVFVDLRIQLYGNRPPPEEVVIVAIDDATLTAEGGYPISRDRLAHIVRRIDASGARAIGVDLLLLSASTHDAALAQALGVIPTVLAGAGQFEVSSSRAIPIPHPDSLLLPLPIFLAEADFGLVNIASDPGGTPRHIPMVFRSSQGLLPSFTLQAVRLFEEQPIPIGHSGANVGGELHALDLGLHLALHYYGPSSTFETISAETLFDEGATDLRLEDRFVLIGATATGIGDRFHTPFDPVLPGVEVLATGIGNLLDGSGLVRNAGVRWVDVVAAGVLSAIAITTLSTLALSAGSAVFILSVLGWIAIATGFFGQGYWMSISLPLAASMPVFFAYLLIGQTLDRRQARRLAMAGDELGRFQSPKLAGHIANDPDFLAHPVEQNAVILFVDLSGFSGVSERIGPGSTRELLKEFHVILTEQVDRHHGLILDFMGDGAMVGFGVPDEEDTAAQHALLAAFVLVDEVGEWLSSPRWQNENLGVRVGVHFGPIVLSRLGHDMHQQIAASGDCVNVASRLLEVAKSLSGQIAASSQVVALADRELLPNPSGVERVQIRGREAAMDVVYW